MGLSSSVLQFFYCTNCPTRCCIRNGYVLSFGHQRTIVASFIVIGTFGACGRQYARNAETSLLPYFFPFFSCLDCCLLIVGSGARVATRLRPPRSDDSRAIISPRAPRAVRESPSNRNSHAHRPIHPYNGKRDRKTPRKQSAHTVTQKATAIPGRKRSRARSTTPTCPFRSRGAVRGEV